MDNNTLTPLPSSNILTLNNASFDNVSSTQMVNRFGIVDYIVFAGMLLISTIIGIYYAYEGRKKNTTQNFLIGSRSMGVLPVSLSLLASFTSAITLLGLPAEVYTYGTQYWMQIITYPIIMFMTSYFYIPVFYNLGVTSSFEYLERRFNRSVRTLGSALFIFQMIFYMSVVLYAPSLALAQVTGIHVWFSILSIGIVCTFYTAIGGIKAVIWTDAFQTVMMFASIAAVVIKGIIDSGGFAEIIKVNLQYERFEFFYMDPNPLIRHTFWTVFFGSIINWGSMYAANQAMVQRYLSVSSLRKAQLSVWIVFPLLTTIISMCCLAGLVIFTRYQHCDPVANKQVSATDQLFPFFVMETMGFIPGFPGLFVAGIFSGALSTISSGLNSLAAVTLEDFVKAYINPNIPESRATIYIKLMGVFYGIISIVFVVMAQNMGNVLQAALAIFGLIGAPIFAMFTLGMFFPSANSKGALWGTLIGITCSLWVGIGAMIYKPQIPKKPMRFDGCSNTFEDIVFITTQSAIDEKNAHIPIMYQVSYMYYGIIGAGVTIIMGYIISSLTNSCDGVNDVDPELLTPIVKKYYKRKYEEKQNPIQHELGMNGLKSFVSIKKESANIHEGYINTSYVHDNSLPIQSSKENNNN